MIWTILGLGLPLTAFALLFVALLHLDGGPHPLRRTFISATLGWGVAVFGITEILSAFGAVSEGGVLIAWLILDVALLVLDTWLGWPRLPLDEVRGLRSSGLVGALVAGCGLVAATTVLIAFVAPPNNWDAMTYHLGRVVHWVENGNVDFYAVQYAPQLYQGPWASYAMLNLLLLSHGDQLVNLVQWFSFLGSALVGSLIAAQLGASKVGQVVAAMMVLTLPMAILQASSAQDHLVVAFWLLCLASLVLASRDGIGWRLTIEAGACLGLAILTKLTVGVLAPPLVLWAAYELVRRVRWGALAHFSVAGLIVVGLNGLHWARNLEAFGFPLGPRADIGAHTNSAFTLRTFLEGAIQETSLQLGLPIHALTAGLTRVLGWIAGVFGLDLNDPATTWPGATWVVPDLTTHEDYAGNLLASLLILGITAIVLLRHRGANLRYLVAILAAYALFVGYVRWELYNSRLQLPLFLLMAPVVGAVIGEWRRSAVALISAVLLAGSLPWLLNGQDRPLIGAASVLTTSRTTQYFANRRDLEEPYVSSAALIERAGCRDVGLKVRDDDPWEYPLWRLLNPAGQQVTLRDVGVSNDTARLETGPPPCMIIFVRAGFSAPQIYHGVDYRVILAAPPVYLYERVSP
jgi:hypothetical protein